MNPNQNIIEENIAMYQHLNHGNVFDCEGMRRAIHNVWTVCMARDIMLIENAMPLHEWKQMMEGRVGVEPLFRLLFIVFKVMRFHDIGLAEVLIEDPAFWLDCVNQGNIMPYYALYHA